MPRVILIGDSIRLSYHTRVARLLEGVADVVGPGENCGSTDLVLEHLDRWVTPHLVPDSVVHLNAGLHDLRRLPDGDRSPQVPLERYRANLSAILPRLSRVARVVVATTTPVDEARIRASSGAWRRAADVASYNAALIDVATQHGAVVHDLHGVIAAAPTTLLSDDGVHLSPGGEAAAAAAVASAVRREIALLRTSQ
jgi:lysophospholipase L1-like esterase